MLSATDLKTGKIFQENNQPWHVVKYSHIKTARGGATIKVKAKNLITGQVIEKSYGTSESIEDANVYRKSAQYLYANNNNYVFMDPETFEQFEINEEKIGYPAKFLLEGINVQIVYFEDNPIAVDLPISVDFEVTYTEPGFKGNTVTNVSKDATLENGTEVKVPAFIKIGDRVKIDTRDGSYLSKA